MAFGMEEDGGPRSCCEQEGEQELGRRHVGHGRERSWDPFDPAAFQA
jgi:hypothetical protein